MEWAAAAAQVAGAGMGLINSNQDRQFNKGQAREADARALANSKDMAMYNRDIAMQMWNDTNYEAQRRHMEKAGLNVGMMYGMGGGGGTTTSSNAGSAQGTASRHQTPPIDISSLANLRLMEAQAKNLEADSKKKEVEAEKMAGVDTDKVKGEIANLAQDINNKKAQEYVLNLEGYQKNASMEDALDYIKWNAEKAEQEVLQSRNQTYVSNNTINEQVTLVKQAAIKAGLENVLIRENTELTKIQQEEVKTKIWKMAQDAAQGWKSLDQNEAKLKLQKFAEELKSEYPGLLNVAGKLTNDVWMWLTGIAGFRNDKFHRKTDE